MEMPKPLLREVSRPFWEAFAEGKLRLQNCAECGLWIFYPRGFCPRCTTPDPPWRAASGRATLYSYTIAIASVSRAIAQTGPLAIGIAELAEGPRLPALFDRLDPDTLRVGIAIRPVFDSMAATGVPLRFELAS